MKHKSREREIEAALTIWSEDPQAIIKQMAALKSIANYLLLKQDSQLIHDQYFDTTNKELETQNLALRIREIGHERLITLKGHLKRTDWGGVERLEIEAPWSEDALIKIIKILQSRKINIQQPSNNFDSDHPLKVLMNLGLTLVQDRVTHRTIRNIVPANKSKSPMLAEFAIDSVAYNFSGQEINLHEVEIEARGDDGVEAVKKVIESLLSIYGSALKKWSHGKLSTGKVIEKLFSNQVVAGWLDKDNNLTPVAYKKIANYFKSNK